MLHKALLLITVLIVLPLQSHAVFLSTILAEQSNVPLPPDEVNSTAVGLNFQETCNMSSRSCQQKNITACLIYSEISPNETFVVVLNNDDKPLNVTIMMLPANTTMKEFKLPSHQMEKINVSSYVEPSSVITLNAGDGECRLHAPAPPPQNSNENQNQNYPVYNTYVTPINGAYLAILLTIIVGASLVYFKLKTPGRQLGSVPYHELEMGNPTSHKQDEAQGWNGDWDDAWGEDPEKVKVKPAKGLILKLADSNGLRKEWDD